MSHFYKLSWCTLTRPSLPWPVPHLHTYTYFASGPPFSSQKIPAVWCSSVITNLTAIMLQLRYRPRILPWPQSLKQLPTPRSHIYDFHSTRLKNKTKQNKTVFVAFPIRALAVSLTEVLVWFITLFQELRRIKAPVLVQSGSPLQVLFNFQQSYEK